MLQNVGQYKLLADVLIYYGEHMAYKLDGLPKELFKKKYQQPTDRNIEGMWNRVASHIASVENGLSLQAFWTHKFYDLLYDFNFIPGGRISAGAGTKNNFLLNCAVLPVEDSIEGIYEAIKQAAVLAKCNYGVGFDFSSIRPSNDDVSRGGTASGPVSFMRVFDSSGAIIETGGGRRAAAIGVLRVDHPNIFEFIDAKHVEGILTQFNISVGITNEFLEAVRADADFDLRFGGKVYRTVKAKDIWKKLVASAYNFNDPGILLLDEVNKFNNGWYLYTIATTNPCGEIPLPPFGVCDLGNLNATKYVKKPFAKMEYVFDNFDFERYVADVKTAVRFLDNVLDASEYPYPEIADRARGDRRIGLNGVAGLGSALAMLRVAYDSEDAIVVAKKLQQVCTHAAYEASIELAKEKGAFPNFDKDKYLQGAFIQTLPSHIRDGIAEFGIRNLALLTIPPVGTGSLLAGNISNGLEPIFALEYNRKVRQPDQSSKDEAVEDYAWGLFKKTDEYLTDRADAKPPKFFKTSREIAPKAHINMQAVLQEFIDGSISKTVNMPESTTLKAYEDTLWYAIESGCKGFTSFREGTREGVLSTKEEDKKPVKAEEKIKAAEPKKKRPRRLVGSTYKIRDDKGNIYVTINDIEEKGKLRPFEIFINANGENSEYSHWYKAIGKILSAVMRRTDDCTFLIKDLQGIYGMNGFFSDGRYVQSQPQMIGNILEEHYRSLDPTLEKDVKFSKCPECGEVAYYKEGGCGKCQSCGFSACG